MDGFSNTTPDNKNCTVVLIGRSGNGKSATGNTIIGKDIFKSEMSLSVVTTKCEGHTIGHNDRIITVIDTPGLFESSAGSEQTLKEIERCVDFARDGIHALLLVLSVKNRFSKEEVDALRDLEDSFGGDMFQYMILLFTGGDALGNKDTSLENYLSSPLCPELLQKVVQRCGNRKLLFDNYTYDENKKCKQVEALLSLVDAVGQQNGGKSYKNEIQESFMEKIGQLETRLRDEQAVRVKSDPASKLAYEEQVGEVKTSFNAEITSLRITDPELARRLRIFEARAYEGRKTQFTKLS